MATTSQQIDLNGTKWVRCVLHFLFKFLTAGESISYFSGSSRPAPRKGPEVLTARQMKDSFCRASIPIVSDEKLRKKYLTVFNTVRFGRLLEDMDTFAGEEEGLLSKRWIVGDVYNSIYSQLEISEFFR